MNPLEENVAGSSPPLNERVSYLNGRFVVSDRMRPKEQSFAELFANSV
jgi:hypothetical protein